MTPELYGLGLALLALLVAVGCLIVDQAEQDRYVIAARDADNDAAARQIRALPEVRQ